MSAPAFGSGGSRTPTGSPVSAGRSTSARRVSSPAARWRSSIRWRHPRTTGSCGRGSTRARRHSSSSSSPTTSATSTFSCAATAAVRSVHGCSGAATSPRRSWSRSSRRSELPGGLVALYDGRGRNETPLWLPEQKTLVFADALTAPAGELRVWATPALEARALPALRAMLELPFERVIVSHGAPVTRPGGVRARARAAAVEPASSSRATRGRGSRSASASTSRPCERGRRRSSKRGPERSLLHGGCSDLRIQLRRIDTGTIVRSATAIDRDCPGCWRFV